MNRKNTHIFLIVLSVVLISCGKSSPSGNHNEIITIDPYSVLRTLENIPIGLNLNSYLDSDKATGASVSITQAIKNMGVKYLRYPGGDKSDEYLFAYPPYEKAHPHPTRKGEGVSTGRENFIVPNGSDYKYPSMDFDEFIDICRATNCEPVIVVAADTRNHPLPEGVTSVFTVEQMLENAVEWVRYSNIKKEYGIKYWMIGNESWHDNVKEHYNLDDYISDIRLFSDAMKAVDPSILIVPNTNGSFAKRLLEEAGDKFDMLCISNYPLFNWSGYEDWASGNINVMNPFNNVANQIEKYAPADKKDMKIIIAEYGAFDWEKNGWGTANDLGHALCNFDITGNQLLEEQIPFSCYWNTRWEYNSDKAGFNALDDNNHLLPVGWTIEFWAKHLFPEMVEAESSSKKLSVFSSHNPATNQAYVYVLNKTKEQINIDFKVKDKEINNIVQVARMYGKSPGDFFPVVDTVMYKMKREVGLPPYSINIYKLNLK